MRILLLRPEPDAARSAAALAARGHDPVVAPLFAVRPTGEPCPQGEFAAILLTSANAAAALAGREPPLPAEQPVYAVGARSAEAARQAGFSQVYSADGSRDDLIRLAGTRLAAGARVLLVLGRDHKADLEPRLRQAGLKPATWLAYEAVAVAALPEAAVQALRAGTLDAVLHYSRRGAETFLARAGAAGCLEALAAPRHLALSADVAAPLRAAGLAAVTVAAHPSEASLLDALDGISARHSSASGDNLNVTTAPDQAPETGPPTGDSMSAGENDRGSDPAAAPAATAGRAGRGRRQAVVIEGDIIRAPGPEASGGRHAAATPETPVPEHADPETVTPGNAGAGDAGSGDAGSGGAGPESPPQTAMPRTAMPETPEPSQAPAARTLPAGRFGTPALLGAGLLGGLVGAGVAILLPWLLPSLDSSAGQTAALEQRLGEVQQGAASRRALEALEARISAAGATATKAESEAAATARRLSELLAAAPAGPDAATLAPIAERARRAEALAASASESLAGRDKALEEAGRRIGDLAGRLATVEQTAKAVGAPSSAALAAARLVITSRLAQALEAGRPFAGDLRALSGGTGADRIDPARLAPLSAVAEKGAPSREALQGEFRRLRPALEQDTVSQSASLGERILKVLDGMVSVRPLGEQPGSSPLALTSRIERALASGDTAAAATAWKQLPEPARRASEAFGAGLGVRAAAIAAIRQLEDEAVAALGAGR